MWRNMESHQHSDPNSFPLCLGITKMAADQFLFLTLFYVYIVNNAAMNIQIQVFV